MRLADAAALDRQQAMHAGLPYVGLEDIESGTGRLLGTLEARAVQSSTFRFTPQHVLYGRLRPYLNKVLAPEFDGHCSTEIIPLLPLSGVLRSYLFYWLTSPATVGALDATSTGARMPRANLEAALELPFPLPDVDEQRRIVAILDEAFEGIATAKAYAEKNLRNARELCAGEISAFLATPREGWASLPIESCFKVKSGDFLPAKAMAGGEIPVFGGNGVTGLHDMANLRGEQIVIGRVGAKCGNVRYVNGDIWLTDNAFYISTFLRPFDLLFLAKILDAVNLRRTANQAAQPVISYTTIKDVAISFPVDVQSQRLMAARWQDLESRVASLESCYLRKLAALDELKQSLLHQAFSGAL